MDRFAICGCIFRLHNGLFLPVNLEILGNRNYLIENKINRSLIDLFLGAINSIILGLLHWTFNNDPTLVVASWLATLYLGIYFEYRLAPPLKKNEFNG